MESEGESEGGGRKAKSMYKRDVAEAVNYHMVNRMTDIPNQKTRYG